MVCKFIWFQVICFFNWLTKLFLLLFTALRVLHISISWLFLTGVWVIATAFKSPGLFSVFWPISIMLSFGWPLVVLLFPSLPILLPSLLGLSQVHQPQLVSPSPSCSIFFLVLQQGLGTFLFSLYYYYFFFTLRSTWTAKSTIRKVLFFSLLFFLLTIAMSGRLAKIRWSGCISKSQRTLCVSFSVLCIYHLFI